MRQLWGVLLALAFVPGLNDPAGSGRWLVLAALPLLLFGAKPTLTPVLALAVMWFWISAVSWFWFPFPVDGALSLFHLALLLCAVVAGQLWGAKAVMPGICLGLGVSSALCIAQVLGWNPVHQAQAPAGLFMNKNLLAEAGVVCLVWAGVERRWVLAGLCAPAVALTSCRSAMLGLGIAVVLWIWARDRFSALCVGALGVLGALYFAAATTLEARLGIWHDSITNSRLWGNGLGSFYSLFPSLSTGYDLLHDRPETPHNELVGWVFELGVGAAIPLGLFVVAFAVAKRECDRLALCALGATMAFGFPLSEPLTLALAGILLGSCGSGNAIRWLCATRERLAVPASLVHADP